VTGNKGLRWWLTAADSADRLTEQAVLSQTGVVHSPAKVWVDSGRRFQTHLGFGGAFTESAAVNWANWVHPSVTSFCVPALM